MTSRTAGDIMIPLDRYPHIPYWFTIRQAVVELEKAEIDVKGRKSLPRSLLVFDEKYQLLGIVRRRDLLRGLEPKFLRTIPAPNREALFGVESDHNVVDIPSGRITNAIREQAQQPISEVMSPIIATVDASDHLAKVVYKMVSHDQTILPVLKDSRVVGVVRSVDVFHEVATVLLE